MLSQTVTHRIEADDEQDHVQRDDESHLVSFIRFLSQAKQLTFTSSSDFHIIRSLSHHRDLSTNIHRYAPVQSHSSNLLKKFQKKMKFAILSTTITTLLLATLTSTSPTPKVQLIQPKKCTPPEPWSYTGWAGRHFHVSDTEVFQIEALYELPKKLYHTKAISIHYGRLWQRKLTARFLERRR
jgi:hypothetical protein